MTLAVVTALVPLYSEGAQAKARALANSLGERVGSVPKSGIDLADIEGIDEMFANYLRLDPDISAIGLVSAGEVLMHTRADAVGKPWITDDGAFEYTVALDAGNAGGKQVAVALPGAVVHAAVAHNVRNFAVLFLAAALIAALFLNLANALTQPGGDDDGSATELERVKPILFLAVFADNLSASFLPQMIRAATDSAQMPASLTSLAFVAYFVCFAAALLPAGRFAQRRDARPLIRAGALLIATGALLLAAVPDHLWTVGAARMISGFGQGMLFIGVQSYILAAATARYQTRANAIIVYTFNGVCLLLPAALGKLVSTVTFILVKNVAFPMVVFVMSIRRLHDLNFNGWWSLTVLVPFVTLGLLFFPGNKEANRFGPPPAPNPPSLSLAALALPAVLLGLYLFSLSVAPEPAATPTDPAGLRSYAPD